MASKKKSILYSTHISLMISALLAAVLLVVVMLSTPYAVSWFKNKLEVPNPAILSNFVTEVTYSTNGTDYATLEAGDAIVLSPEQLSNLRIQVGYQGFSQAYLRVSVFGSFKNKNTGTFLPQSDAFWMLTGNDSWVADTSGEYLYYSALLEKTDTMTALAAFTLSADIASLGDISAHQNYESELYVLVDAVQPNRYQEHWGIAELPFA